MVDLSIEMIRELQRVAELYQQVEGQRLQRSPQADTAASQRAQRARRLPVPARQQG
jgi:hypothetical protein